MTAEREQLEQAIAALEAQRVTLGDAVVDAAIAPLRQKLAALAAPSPQAQRKQITVLFADVSGFTALSETMDPEDVHTLINDLWRRLDAAIIAQGGLIDKHIGDAVMALFGAPTAREDDPERAIRAALAMQEALADFGRVHSVDLMLRIGINTGLVLLGEVGATAEYTAMGDTVNLASRLEQAAPPGGVLICHDTYRHVRGLFAVTALEPLTVKGKSRPVQAYLVEGVKPRAFRVISRGVEGVETPLIGRDDEMGHLQGALQTVLEEGALRLVTITGEAGIGKSRLLDEFDHRLELIPQRVRFFKGRAEPQWQQLPNSLLRDLLAFRFEIQDSDTAVLARQKLTQGISAFLGPDSEEQIHFIGHLIGFDFSHSPYLRGILDDAPQIRDRAFHYLTEFFRIVAEERPVVIFLEDIHWADDNSLDFVEYLAQNGADLPLLVVCLARPLLLERRPAWRRASATHIFLPLHPLSAEDSGRLVNEILQQAGAIPPDLRDLVVEGAEGNPFYVEELIKMLIEDGVVVTGSERWRVHLSRLSAVRVPPTLTEILQARVDRLPPPQRETLQQAAVVGRVFWEGAVAMLGGDDARPAQKALGALRRKEMVFRRPISAFAGTREYTFKHIIMRDVTYESVLKRVRRRYHAQVATWLVEQGKERVAEHAGLIGEHYERAGETAQAARWYARAGKQAQDTYAAETAVDYYQRALSFLPSVAEADAAQAARLVRVHEGLGHVLRWQARFNRAAEAFRAMEEAAQAAGDEAARARAWNDLSQVQDLQADYRQTLASGERAATIARAAGAPARVELARALFRQGWGHYRLRQIETALKLAEEGLSLSRELDARREMSYSLNLLGAANQSLGRYEAAAAYFEQALELFRASGNRRMEAGVLNNLGVNDSLNGDYGRAITRYEEALAIAREIGSRDGEMVFLSNLGGMRVRHGQFEAAEENLRQVIEIAEAGGSKFPGAYNFLAEACLGQGKVAEALAAARRARRIGREVNEVEATAVAWRLLGLIAAESEGSVSVAGQTYRPPVCFAESVRLLEEMGAEGDRERAWTLREWANYALRGGNAAEGYDMWREAREIFARLGLAHEIAQMEEAERNREGL